MLRNPHERNRWLHRIYYAFAAGFVLGAAFMASPAIGLLMAILFGADILRRIFTRP